VPFACGETNVAGSYLTQVHLQHELESKNYGVFLSDNDLYIKIKRMGYLSGRSDFKLGAIIAQHRHISKQGNSLLRFLLVEVAEADKTNL
jgi:hypothetical protein